jgi:hypothetical protein
METANTWKSKPRRSLKQERVQEEIWSIERQMRSTKDIQLACKLKHQKLSLEQKLYTMKFNRERQRKLRAKRRLEFELRYQFDELAKSLEAEAEMNHLDSGSSSDDSSSSSGTSSSQSDETRDIDVLFKVITGTTVDFESFIRHHTGLLLQDMSAAVKLQLLRNDFVECAAKFGRAFATSSLLLKLKTFLM